MRLLLIGVGNSARSCFNRLPDHKDWVKAAFLNNTSAPIHADRIFIYGEKNLGRLDGSTIQAKEGMARLHDPIITLVNESLYEAVIIFCFMGGSPAYGLSNLVHSIEASGKPAYLISSIPFAAEGKRKRLYMKECLDSIVDRLSGIYLLDMEDVFQYALKTAKEQTMLAFLQSCDTIILNFFSHLVTELQNLDRGARYIFLYDYLASELTVRRVPEIKNDLYAVL